MIFSFELVDFPALDGDIPRSPSYGVYILQLIRFVRVCSNVSDFNSRNQFLTLTFSNKFIDIIKFLKHFLNSTKDNRSGLIFKIDSFATGYIRASVLW